MGSGSGYAVAHPDFGGLKAKRYDIKECVMRGVY
jgi:hypothetical protein